MSRARLLLALALPALACARPDFVAPACTTDDQCGDGQGCVSATCLPRATGAQTWAVELAPRADSTSAVTELPSVSGPSPLVLAATTRATLAASFTLDAPAAGLAKAHLLLTVPSVIPGRDALTFEGDLPSAVDPAAPAVTLPIPSQILGRTGLLGLSPTAPDNATHAPASFSFTVAPTVQLPLSAKAVTVRGRLLSALGDARSGFVARAFRDGALVSNADVTKDGVFTLMIPAGLAPPEGDTMISVALAPPADSTMDPWLSVKAFPLQASKELGDLKLPPFGQPNVFRFVAHGHASDGPTIMGAVVRARIVLAEDAATVTDFQRDGLTDADGRTSLALLPGSTSALRNYELAVIPPPDSLYGIRCIPKFPLATGGTADVPANVPALVLPVRPIVNGTITGHGGVPAPGVIILATRVMADAASPCASAASAPPATTTTDAKGGYRLPLDPGVYRIDYDPPAGSPFPRYTETGVTVPAPPAADDSVQVSHTVQLPQGLLIEGDTRDARAQPLPLAGVRLYEVRCTGPATCEGPARVAPVLRAQARSDAAGHFRAVAASPR